MEAKHRHTIDLTWKIHRILNKFQQLESTAIQVDRQMTITHRELHVIQVIGETEEINITKLGNHFGVTKSAASQLVSKLKQKGLVEKEQSGHSGKELQLSLTGLGWKAFELHEEYHSKNLVEIIKRLEPFSIGQIMTTTNILDIIERVAEESLKRA
jgi:DNA-binding MarR family transcriptional regulator